MNPNKQNPFREAHLEKMSVKYGVKEPVLNFDTPSDINIERPVFDPNRMNLDPYSGPWSLSQITHLIRRLKFGITKADLEYFNGLSMEESVELLLTEAPVPDPPINDYNADGIFDPDIPVGETWVHAPYNGELEGGRVISLKRWWMENILNQGHSITEKMLLFWHNHLVTEWYGVFVGFASYRYMETLRKFQMGNFKELMKAITIDISMLFYLNGAQNHKEAPDENYARELQELFCIGKGPNANFTEEDIRETARVLTGWTVSWPDINLIYDQWRHDNGDKQFSSFYNNTKITGRSGDNGKVELDELLDMIFENNETALHICRRIYTFFVYPEINEEVENNVIVPLAEILRSNDFEIKPVLESLFKSEHFYDPKIKGALIKDPVNHLLGLWKVLRPPLPADITETQKTELKNSIFWSMHNNGMQLGDPPSVAGWSAYYQAPIFDKGWITTNTITDRAIHTDSLIYWGFWSPSHQVPADLVAFAQTLDEPGDPNKLIDQITTIFLGHDISEEGKSRLKSILLSNQAEDYYWTTAWNAFMQDPQNNVTRLIIENRLKWTMQRILQLAEFHLM